MTGQEQTVADRLIAMIDAADETVDVVPARNVLRAIGRLELSPEECTVDVLRALWVAHMDFAFDHILRPGGAWVERIWDLVSYRGRERQLEILRSYAKKPQSGGGLFD
ncbi:hypothetical protein LCGC14_1434890 [marine sediment metagenome]|uniref:Uncharacterized protein n=1 Tax=marine sediment metagenome TaxID=412755 RepID=A0A0F9JN00_9ZZZZ